MTSLECLPNPLPPLLNELYADKTALTTLPDLPPKLRLLYIDSTLIQELQILPPELRDLSIAHTPIRELPYLSQDLMFLNLEGTPIKRLHASQFKHIDSPCCIRTPAMIDDFLSLPGNIYTIEFTNPDFSVLDLPIDEYFKRIYSTLPAITFKYKGKFIEIKPYPDTTDESLLELQAIVDAEMENIKTRIVQRTLAVKEDLMIKTWHPSRVEAWCGVRFDTIDDE
jgi:Leucine-rich repeat (LRR) protein